MRKITSILACLLTLMNTQSNAQLYRGVFISSIRIPNDMSGKTAFFYGDSITEGYNASPSTSRWSTLLCALFGASENNIAVSGKNMQGSSSCNAAGSFDKTTISTYNAATSGAMFIGLGTNDILQNNGVSLIAAYETKYLDVLDYAITTKGWPPSKIMVLTPYYVINLAAYVGVCGSSSADQTRVDQYVQKTRDVAAAKGVNLIDTYTFTSTSSAYIASIAGDNLHPNNTGYALLASYIENQFQ